MLMLRSSPRVLAHYLAAVDVITRIDEELAPVQKLVHRVGDGGAGLKGDERAVGTVLDLTLVRLVLLESVSHDRLAL